MKKHLFLLVFILMLRLTVSSQVSLQPVLPFSGIMQKNMLWNIAVINTSRDNYSCRLELVLRDRASGLEVLTATTASFTVTAGAMQLNASALLPIQYNHISGVARTGQDEILPIGSYLACYRLTADAKDLLAEECASFDVEPLSPPMLIHPADSSVLEALPNQFAWIPPAPMNLFSRLQYDVVFAEVLPGQKADEAMQQNLPFYTESNVGINNLNNPSTGSSFEKDTWYAWQVIARDAGTYAGKSEVWVFKAIERFNTSIESATPFTKIKTDNPELAIAPNGILKIAYYNETKDSTGRVLISDFNAQGSGGKQVSFTTTLAAGDNFIQYDLKKIMKPREGQVYTAELINRRGEKFSLRFTIKYFKK